MVDCFGSLPGKNFLYPRVPDVHLVELGPRVQVFDLPCDQAVDHDHLVPPGSIPIGHLRPDKPRPACNQNFHSFPRKDNLFTAEPAENAGGFNRKKQNLFSESSGLLAKVISSVIPAEAGIQLF